MQQLKRFFPLIAGLLFTVLIVFSVLRSGGTPGTNESPAKILAWYQVAQDKNKVSSAGFLTAWGVIAGFAFFGRLFARLRGKSPVLAAVGLAGAAVFAVGGLLSAGVYLSLGDTPSIMTAGTAQTLNFLQFRPVLPVHHRRAVHLLPGDSGGHPADQADSHPAHLGLDHGGLRGCVPDRVLLVLRLHRHGRLGGSFRRPADHSE